MRCHAGEAADGSIHHTSLNRVLLLRPPKRTTRPLGAYRVSKIRLLPQRASGLSTPLLWAPGSDHAGDALRSRKLSEFWIEPLLLMPPKAIASPRAASKDALPVTRPCTAAGSADSGVQVSPDAKSSSHESEAKPKPLV